MSVSPTLKLETTEEPFPPPYLAKLVRNGPHNIHINMSAHLETSAVQV